MTKGNQKMIKIFAGLGSLFACLLIALGFKIYFAVKTYQPVLNEGYYETGRLYDQHLKKIANSRDRRLSSPLFADFKAVHIPIKDKLKIGENYIPVKYTNQNQIGINNAKVIFQLGRRATNNQNLEASCTTNQDGQCEIRIQIPAKGYWEGGIFIRDAMGQYSKRGSFIAKGSPK